MKKELTYEERIKWFFDNYYETGMEYSIMLDTMKEVDLDYINWYGSTIKIPRYIEVNN